VFNRLHYSEAREAQREQRAKDTAAYVSGIVDPEQKQFVRQSLDFMASRKGAIPPVHPLPQRDTSNKCPLLKRVLAQAYREDDPENNGDSYLDDNLRLVHIYYHEPDGGFTAPDEVMRILKGVMLNGLCRSTKQFEIELNQDAVPHFVQGMKVEMPDLQFLHIRFHPDVSEHDLVTVLNCLRASHGRLHYLIMSGTVPRLDRDMKFLTQLGILRIESESFGDESVALLTESAQFTKLHSLYLENTRITNIGLGQIRKAHTQRASHDTFKVFVSPYPLPTPSDPNE
jgi:hypothetical protein